MTVLLVLVQIDQILVKFVLLSQLVDDVLELFDQVVSALELLPILDELLLVLGATEFKLFDSSDQVVTRVLFDQ